MTILKFEIVSGYTNYMTLEYFCEEVAERLLRGWEVYGDMDIVGETIFLPMILKGEDKEIKDGDDILSVEFVKSEGKKDIEEFQKEVNRLINEGYKLLGKTIFTEKGFFQLLFERQPQK